MALAGVQTSQKYYKILNRKVRAGSLHTHLLPFLELLLKFWLVLDLVLFFIFNLKSHLVHFDIYICNYFQDPPIETLKITMFPNQKRILILNMQKSSLHNR